MRILVVALMLVALTAAPAQAATTVVSRDGSHWSASLDRPLFDPQARWVPGDVREESFWVRNQASTAGSLTLSVDSGDADRLLVDDVIRLQAQAAAGRWVDLDRIGTAYRLDTALEPETRTRVTIRATYGAAAGNVTQRDRASLTFVVTLTDNTRSGTGPLPGTGAPALRWLVVAGALSLVLGMALIRARRTRGDRHD